MGIENANEIPPISFFLFAAGFRFRARASLKRLPNFGVAMDWVRDGQRM